MHLRCLTHHAGALVSKLHAGLGLCSATAWDGTRRQGLGQRPGCVHSALCRDHGRPSPRHLVTLLVTPAVEKPKHVQTTNLIHVEQLHVVAYIAPAECSVRIFCVYRLVLRSVEY